MKAEDFRVIETTIEEAIKNVEKVYIYDSEEFEKLPVGELISRIRQSRVIQAEMDKFLIDLYHIIGMASMDAAQTCRFMKLCKEYLKYRSNIKIMACMDLPEKFRVPKIKPVSSFQCSFFDLEVSSERPSK